MNINNLSHSRILNTKICDLGLTLRGSDLEPLVRTLHRELQAAGLRHLRPNIYLGDEWFSPEGAASISVPFWLAHPKLRQIESSLMKQVEGGTRNWGMRLLRHEAGHCFDHIYHVSKTSKWQEIFGDPSVAYDPDSYSYIHDSRDFVNNLEKGYGQSHPDEDFAETFAIVVRPNSRWRQIYCNSPVILRKLNYVQGLIDKYGNRRPRSFEKSEMCSARKMRMTLSSYYESRQKIQPACIKVVAARK